MYYYDPMFVCCVFAATKSNIVYSSFPNQSTLLMYNKIQSLQNETGDANPINNVFHSFLLFSVEHVPFIKVNSVLLSILFRWLGTCVSEACIQGQGQVITSYKYCGM